MNNLRLTKITDDSEFQGAVEPKEGPWKLMIDHEGLPHLLLETTVELDSGERTRGWVSIEDFLPDGLDVRSIIKDAIF